MITSFPEEARKAQRSQASYPRPHSQQTPGSLTFPHHPHGACLHQGHSHIPRTCNKKLPGPLAEQRAGSLSWLMFICLCPRLPAKPSLETQSDSETSPGAAALGWSQISLQSGRRGGSGQFLVVRWSRAPLPRKAEPTRSHGERSRQVDGRERPAAQPAISMADTFTRPSWGTKLSPSP